MQASANLWRTRTLNRLARGKRLATSGFGIKEDRRHEDEAVRIAAARRRFAVCRESLVDRHRHRSAILRSPSSATGCGLLATLSRSGVHVGPGLLLSGWRAACLACRFLVAPTVRRRLLGRAALLRASLLSRLLGTTRSALGSR